MPLPSHFFPARRVASLPAAVALVTLTGACFGVPAGAAGINIRLGVPVVQQDMPLDCESAALAAAMRYKGASITQNEIFNALPKDLRAAQVSGGRLLHWGDPYSAFVGNVYGSEAAYTGYGVYYPPIAAIAQGHGLTTASGSGWSLNSLVTELEAGNPVVVWVNWHLLQVPVTSYVAFDGRRVWFSTHEHAQVLIGFDQATGSITLMDPLDGDYQTYAAWTFMARFDAMGAEAVAVWVPKGRALPPVIATAGSSQSANRALPPAPTT